MPMLQSLNPVHSAKEKEEEGGNFSPLVMAIRHHDILSHTDLLATSGRYGIMCIPRQVGR